MPKFRFGRRPCIYYIHRPLLRAEKIIQMVHFTSLTTALIYAEIWYLL